MTEQLYRTTRTTVTEYSESGEIIKSTETEITEPVSVPRSDSDTPVVPTPYPWLPTNPYPYVPGAVYSDETKAPASTEYTFTVSNVTHDDVSSLAKNISSQLGAYFSNDNRAHGLK